MKNDIALRYNEEKGYFDIALDGGDLVDERGLETSVILSLFTDRRADADDALPDDSGDRRGFWADAYADIEGDKIGSRLWLLARSKDTPEVLRLAREYGQEALQWMLDDKVSKSLNIESERVRSEVLGLLSQIQRPTGVRYERIWEYQLGGAV